LLSSLPGLLAQHYMNGPSASRAREA